MTIKGAPVVYRASVFAAGEFLSLEKTTEGNPRVRIRFGTNQLELPIYPKLFARLAENPLSGTCQFLIYPRTDLEGVLCKGAWAGDVYPVPKRVEMLSALGELVRVDRGDGLIHVRLHPNPKGALRRSFSLPLNASLEVIDTLPQLGRGVIIEGCFRAQSLRLVATSAQEVALPVKRDARVVRPIPESRPLEQSAPEGGQLPVREEQKGKHSW